MREVVARGGVACAWSFLIPTLVACGGEPARQPPAETAEPGFPEMVAMADHHLPDAESDRVARDGLTLSLTLDDGSTVEFHDVPVEGEAYRRYRFMGMLDGLPYFIVLGQYFEGGNYRLVHRHTGEQLALDAWPSVSPDRLRLVTTSMGRYSESTPNRIQIYRYEDDSLRLEWEVQPPVEGWGPSDAKWLDERAVVFVKSTPEFSVVVRYDEIPDTLRLGPDGWKLESGG
jgi:hypothetical protein